MGWLHWLTDLVSASPLTYLVVASLCVVDVVGVFPAETVVATATLVALDGGLVVVGIAVAAALGAFAGDNILYLLGRRVGDRLTARLFRSDSARERLEWARRQMDTRGRVIIVAGRFIPMGRTATMFAAGTLSVPWRVLVAADLVAVALWTGYWVGVTAITGETFSGKPWLSLVLSLGVAVAVGAAAEAVRRYGRPRVGRRRSH